MRRSHAIFVMNAFELRSPGQKRHICEYSLAYGSYSSKDVRDCIKTVDLTEQKASSMSDAAIVCPLC